MAQYDDIRQVHLSTSDRSVEPLDESIQSDSILISQTRRALGPNRQVGSHVRLSHELGFPATVSLDPSMSDEVANRLVNSLLLAESSALSAFAVAEFRTAVARNIASGRQMSIVFRADPTLPDPVTTFTSFERNQQFIVFNPQKIDFTFSRSGTGNFAITSLANDLIDAAAELSVRDASKVSLARFRHFQVVGYAITMLGNDLIGTALARYPSFDLTIADGSILDRTIQSTLTELQLETGIPREEILARRFQHYYREGVRKYSESRVDYYSDEQMSPAVRGLIDSFYDDYLDELRRSFGQVPLLSFPGKLCFSTHNLF